MELAFAASVYPANGTRAIHEIKPLSPKLVSAKKRSFHNRFLCSVVVAPDGNRVSEVELENRKHDLLLAVQDTQRGLVATADQRSVIEEALVCVEGYNRGAPIDLVMLDGTWRLQYTSAPDVLILLEAAARLPFFQVGQIFQKFECRNQYSGGVIRNVVRWSIPNLLEEQEGATLVVSAKFEVVSVRNIYLLFEEILQFLRTFSAQVPIRNPGTARRSVGGLYYLSYLDKNMLLGRAVGGGGIFVFTKAQPLEL
ncbi:probable plastid-lipid-associated protein 10, chloroplastic isoform X4 [Durio zibethinus]|uniref:Probable plastid-lipid-associated protein 10, chloroplastic isoform X4 n=1 Tax=Durio zibethinus TaxID=66656 RepID=A0A6P6B0G5_DURZI|nr:probable plastid-lipid-associated protein 10, chloroplastic isoform X4 [Durio zibethinus]